VTYVVTPAESRRPRKKPSPVIAALAATACIAAGAGGYFLLSGSSSSENSAHPVPVVHHATTHKPTSASATAAQKAAAAQALLTRSMAAMRAKGSFATASTTSEDGVTGHGTGWTGLTTASSTEEIDGQGQAMLRIVGPAAYFVGDAAVLKTVAGVDPEAADLLGDKWLEIAKGDSGYDDIMADSTLSQTLSSEDWFSGAIAQSPVTTLNGQRVIPLRGAAAKDSDYGPHATAVLYVAADGDPLPVRYEVNSDTDHDVADFSGWGSSQTVLAPPVAIDKAWLENAAAAEAAHPCGCASTSSIT
jgi:hypothetical protein